MAAIFRQFPAKIIFSGALAIPEQLQLQNFSTQSDKRKEALLS